MTRFLLLLAAGLATAACSPLDDSLDRIGTVHLRSTGVALFADGDRGHAGMLGSTCELRTGGAIGGDVPVGGSGRPEILGGGTAEDGDEVVLARTRGAVHILSAGSGGMFSSTSVRAAADIGPDLSGAVLTSQGPIVRAGCELLWLDHDLVERDRVAAGLEDACDEGSFTAVPSGEVAYLATGGQVFAVGPDRLDALDLAGTDITYSTATDALVLTDPGSRELTATTPSGELLWTLDAGGPIVQVHDFEGSDYLLVTVEEGYTYDLLMIDAPTGEIHRAIPLPNRAQVYTSSDGRTMALARPNMTQFFRLR
ncbi:MAG: hypothetical protein EA397_16765 [Deltaproteobacteria bacterium]|nr:MAG: hypothetical protein EA397_16765 [Deltaproteobacteria bacterium]